MGSHGPGWSGQQAPVVPVPLGTLGLRELTAGPRLPPLLGGHEGENGPSERYCCAPTLQLRKLRQVLGKLGLGWAGRVVLEPKEKAGVCPVS